MAEPLASRVRTESTSSFISSASDRKQQARLKVMATVAAEEAAKAENDAARRRMKPRLKNTSFPRLVTNTTPRQHEVFIDEPSRVSAWQLTLLRPKSWRYETSTDTDRWHAATVIQARFRGARTRHRTKVQAGLVARHGGCRVLRRAGLIKLSSPAPTPPQHHGCASQPIAASDAATPVIIAACGTDTQTPMGVLILQSVSMVAMQSRRAGAPPAPTPCFELQPSTELPHSPRLAPASTPTLLLASPTVPVPVLPDPCRGLLALVHRRLGSPREGGPSACDLLHRADSSNFNGRSRRALHLQTAAAAIVTGTSAAAKLIAGDRKP
jgi:hypothetical protein